ncbi:putative cell surface protein [Aspergillus fijiensis CBS 313.89]|uniref:Siderophore biosynthesis enzyme n=1 Tax=Aspergillus fijiensis CBS 313.89 TaxID=1448319 RepID=A0A8G1VUC9_9EURO|nr:uncharacterized protein BO72DRAFT_489161 [Aspergillus fijiensis CBS 313.89]RAK73290.1 hypothetical protein BO72DRAFT_489161 [Aspergillus fijiensis CBS 313.89]
MKLLTTTISFFLGLTLVVAKTDIGPPCTSSTTYVGGIFTRIFYIPDTGELCELIDCGGGRAPPKTTVPGCPLYSGTEPVPTHYLPGWGPNGRLIETTTTTTSGAAEATSETSAITATAGAGGSVYASASSSSSSSSATATDAAAAQITGPSASDSARDSASTALTSRSGAMGSAAAAANATTTGVVRGNDAAAGFRVRSAGVAGVVGAVVLVGGVML